MNLLSLYKTSSSLYRAIKANTRNVVEHVRRNKSKTASAILASDDLTTSGSVDHFFGDAGRYCWSNGIVVVASSWSSWRKKIE